MDEPHFGFMLQPGMGNRLPHGATWAGDTGCFLHPDSFDLDQYLRWLNRKGPRADCLFVTAPDVCGDAVRTLERSLPVLPRLRAEGWRPALVAQNGLRANMVPWEEIDTLFIGGTIEWKEGKEAAVLIREAIQRAKGAHVGRVNTPERMSYAARAGATSVDGTRMAFGFDKNWPLIREWMRCINGQQSFSFLAE